MADTKRAMDRKFVPEPYDMDTMLGTNNSGVLMFPPYLEDTDTVSAVISGEGGSDAPVFNAQDSVLWNNLRDAFRDQITAMYKELRAGNKWNAKYIVAYFEEMQSKWPEAMFNEDGKTKYLIPLIDPVTVDEDTGELIRTDRYLTMLQGSKAEQRKWWTYDRFRYTDSKYNTGDASKTINLRLFNGGTLTITPAIDLYVGVSFGGGTTPALKRTKAGQPQTFEYVAPSGVTEMETWIYSADQITDLGDLSVFYPNEIDVSRGSRLRTLNIGSLAEGYSNSNLTTINASNNPLLEYINCANCPRLAISPNLEKSVRLKEAYFEGSGITGIELADGCTVEKLHLPASVTSLILTNLNKLTDLQIEDMSNITRVMLSNMSTDIIDPMTVLESIPAGSQVYIDGLDITLANDTELQEFIDFLDTMRGVTRERSAKGEWLYHDQETAQINGVIHVDTTTGAMAKQLKDKYPYITLDFKHISCTVTFHNYNGTSVLQTKTSSDGAAVTYTGSTPTKPSSVSHDFTFAGWSYQIDGVKNDNALKNVTEDRDLYPAFTSALRKFTVKFNNYNGTTLQTVNNVQYGASANYTGATPINNSTGDASDFEFIGWSPEPINIVGETTCVAQFRDVSSVVLQYLKKTLRSYESEANTIIRPHAFYGFSKLETVKGPFNSFGGSCFTNCNKLSTLDLTSNEPITLPNISGVDSLDALVLRSSSKFDFPTNGLPCRFKSDIAAVYVLPELVSSYKEDDSWGNYIIASINDYKISNYETITDSLETIINNIHSDNIDQYKIGSIKSFMFDGKLCYLQLIAKHKDILTSDVSKTAPTTWRFRHGTETYNFDSKTSSSNPYPECNLTTRLQTYKNKLPDIIQQNLLAVNKTTLIDSSGTLRESSELIWIPSLRELGYTDNQYVKVETSGAVYDQFFKITNDPDKRRIVCDPNGAPRLGWCRSGNGTTSNYITDNGGMSSTSVTSGYLYIDPYICL